MKKWKALYLPFLCWGVIFVLLHDLFYNLGWYADSYDLSTTIRKLIGVVLFKHVEGLVVPTWFLQSLFKGLVITYMISCLPRRWMQWCSVILLYLVSCYCDSEGIHLFYSFNRDFGVVIAIYLGYILREKNHQLSQIYIWISFVFLLVAAMHINIDMVSGTIGPISTFPILTIVGTTFIYNVAIKLQKWMPSIYEMFTFFGRNSLYILILHFTGFHVLSHLIVLYGLGKADELCGMTTLVTINHVVWWVPYTFSGMLMPLLYILVKNKILKQVLLLKKLSRKDKQ